MAGMFSNNNDFSWGPSDIFDDIGNPEKRDEYLQNLSGTGNNERKVIEQLRSLDESEMKQVLYDIAPEEREDFLETYYGLKDVENISPSPEISVTGPQEMSAPSSGMLGPLDLNASVNF